MSLRKIVKRNKERYGRLLKYSKICEMSLAGYIELTRRINESKKIDRHIRRYGTYEDKHNVDEFLSMVSVPIRSNKTHEILYWRVMIDHNKKE